MHEKRILLVEDNSDDEVLTLIALKKGRVKNAIDVVRDGAEALDFLFCRGAYEARSPTELPQVVLLDLKLPKIDGMEVLRQIRANDKTKLLPVVIMTSSKEQLVLSEGNGGIANSYIVKPVDATQFIAAMIHLGMYWMVLSESP